jgi:biotin operon repressor
LERVDALAADLGQSRAGIINLAIHRVVEHGVQIDGRRGG